MYSSTYIRRAARTGRAEPRLGRVVRKAREIYLRAAVGVRVGGLVSSVERLLPHE